MAWNDPPPKVQYWLLDDGPDRVFRLRWPATGGLYIERWSTKRGEWYEGWAYSLLRYTHRGEVGADRIDAATADRLIASGALRLVDPTAQSDQNA